MAGNETTSGDSTATSGLADRARREAGEMAEEVRREAAKHGETARETLTAYAERGKEAGAHAVEGVAKALHSAADEMDRSAPAFGRYAHQAAEAVDEMTDTLRRRSAGELMRQVTDFARREPVVFFGGALLVGFAVSRFLSSGRSRMAQPGMGFPSSDRSWDRDSMGSERSWERGAMGSDRPWESGRTSGGPGARPSTAPPSGPAGPVPTGTGGSATAGGSEFSRHVESSGQGVGEAGPRDVKVASPAGTGTARTSPLVSEPVVPGRTAAPSATPTPSAPVRPPETGASSASGTPRDLGRSEPPSEPVKPGTSGPVRH